MDPGARRAGPWGPTPERALYRTALESGVAPPRCRPAPTPRGCSPVAPCVLHCADALTPGHLVCARRSVRAGASLYQQGGLALHVFAVRSGAFKSTLTLSDGRGQVCGFHMKGDVIALEGIGHRAHACSMTALEDAEVCVMAFRSMVHLAQQDPPLLVLLSQIMSRDLAHSHKTRMLLGHSLAQERLAVFLLELSRRFNDPDGVDSDFHLSMTRAEIASFLGLSLETVSRNFTALQRRGELRIDQRHVHIPDLVDFTQRYGALLPD